MEEPPQKITKFEMDSQYLEGEVMEEGQEEWLSEGVLTDDDYNPASQTEPDPNDSNVTSQDGTVSTSQDQSQDETMNTASADDSQNQQENSKMDSSNIEETLNNFENSQNNNQTSDFPEELNAFLIRKSDGLVVGSDPPKKESDIDESAKQSEDDGNDTDDLLRVLGDGDKSSDKIKKIETRKTHGDSSDEDDSYIFEGKKKNYKMAKMVLNRAPVTKAVPEDDDVTSCSDIEDEMPIRDYVTLKKNIRDEKMAEIKKKAEITKMAEITTNVKPGNLTITPPPVKEEPKKIIKKVIDIVPRNSNDKDKKRAEFKSEMMKKAVKLRPSPQEPPRQYVNKRVQSRPHSQTAPSGHKPATAANNNTDHDTDNDSLEEGQIEFNRNEKSTPKTTEQKQSVKLMRPEEMDEEMLSDNSSDSEEESLLSELPSSDSDVEDWFVLDVRSERAGDYIPLLGDKAYQLLSEEKRRVAARLDTLKKSLATVSASGQELADKLREATNTHAELDAMLKIV